MYTENTQNIENSKNIDRTDTAYSNKSPLVKIKTFGIWITNEKEDNILEYIVSFIKNSSKNLFIITPNPEIIMFAQAHPEFKAILNKAEIALCDGIGLFTAARVLGNPLKQRIIGTNFMEKLCEKVSVWPITIGLLGGKPGVAEKTAECLLARYPKLSITFAEADETKLLSLPKEKFPQVLFVAFGAPKQEEWMADNIEKLPIRVMMGVGGAFDQIVSPNLRPPAFIHYLGFGWFYRLIRQPWRLKRQLQLFSFIKLVLEEKFLPLSQVK